MPRLSIVLSVICLGIGLAACERRPTDPPKPSTLAEATPVTAGLAGLGTPPDAKPPHGPASDPPKGPPQPAPRPPSQPSSAASAVMR
jgi:hypothetical protein